MKPTTPSTVRFAPEVDERLRALLAKYPSHSFRDVLGLAVSRLIDQIDAGAKLADLGNGLELLQPPHTPAQLQHAPGATDAQAKELRALAIKTSKAGRK